MANGLWRRLSLGSVCLVLGMCALVKADDPPSNELAQYYGFMSLEIFKVENRSANLLSGDFNHDGLLDVALADNSNNRIDLFLQRKSKPEATPEKGEVNAFQGDWRFEHKKLPVDKAISAMAVGDFNGDQRPDIAYFGNTDRLVILTQPEQGEWKPKQNFRLPDVTPGSWIVAAGDLNHDGSDDIAVLGKNDTFLLYQKDKQLQAPERLMNTSDKLGLASIGDVDGDGRSDLSYIANDEGGRSLCARLQSPNGKLGPELQFDLDRPRATTVRDLDGEPGMEILSIHGTTGRLQVSQLRRPAAKQGELAAQLVQFGLGQGAGARDRDLAVGDVTGDGLIDVICSDPEAAQMIVFSQQQGLGLDQGHSFPGLVGVTQVRLGDLDGDNKVEIVVLSPREKTIGVSHLDQGRLSFPQPLPVEKDPVMLAVADLSGDKLPDVLYLSRTRTSSSSTYTLHGLQASKGATGTEWKPMLFGDKTELQVALKGDPEQILPLDANRDGRTDLLVLQGSERPAVYLQTNEQGIPTAVTVTGGFPLGNLSASSTTLGQFAEPALIVAQSNFARQFRLNEKQQWQVVDQFGAQESGSKVAAAATLNLDGQPGNEIVLVDLGVKKLRVLRQDQGLFKPWKEVEIGAFPFKSLQVADLNGDSLDDLLLFGGSRFGVLFANQTNPQLNEIATFETSLERAFLADVAVGDLNHDGRRDLAVMETRSHRIEILDYAKATGLRHATSFTVFESKSFHNENEARIEPREALIADFTGDGRDDLVLLVHDRILLYPQE